jgi:hypothetical protein
MLAPPKPPAPEPEALIPEARERQRRRRLMVAISVATIAGLGLAIYSVVRGPDTTTGSRGPSAGAPSCRSSQLAASFTPGGSAGTDFGGLIVRNTGGATCLLPDGRPQVSVTFRGKLLRTVESSWPPVESFGKPAHALAPGASAFVEVGWSNACQRAMTTPPSSKDATLRVRFRNGLSMIVPETAPDRSVITPGCNGIMMRPTPTVFVSGFLRL